MAIKVLKRGTKKKVECPECGSLLSYDEAEDVEVVEKPSIGYLSFYHSGMGYIICPCCERKFEVDVYHIDDISFRSDI